MGGENTTPRHLRKKETSESAQVRKSAALARRGKQDQGEGYVGCQATGHLDESKISLLLITKKITFYKKSSYFPYLKCVLKQKFIFPSLLVRSGSKTEKPTEDIWI